MTFAGAVVVGCMESYLTGYLPSNSIWPGLRLAAPALLLFAALLVFPHGRLHGRTRRLHPVPGPTLRGSGLFAVAIVMSGGVLAAVLGPADLITSGASCSRGLGSASYGPLCG